MESPQSLSRFTQFFVNKIRPKILPVENVRYGDSMGIGQGAGRAKGGEVEVGENMSARLWTLPRKMETSGS